MKKYILIFFLLPLSLFAQEAKEDVFKIVEEMPRFPGCEEVVDLKERKECSTKKMLEFIYQNISYPTIARENGVEGTVVIRFIVAKDGSIEEPTIVRDIGANCGTEALRVVNLMNDLAEKWTPGMQDGKPVKVYFNLPVKYRLEKDPPPPPPAAEYEIVNGDSVWLNYDTPPEFDEGDLALYKYFEDNLKMPLQKELDDCPIGLMDFRLIIHPNGLVSVGDVTDYMNLGFDYQFEAIQVATSTFGKWKPALKDGRKVSALYIISIPFVPKGKLCKATIDQFNEANDYLEKGVLLQREGKDEEAIVFFDKAIALFPTNAQYLEQRGNAYLNLGKFNQACEDMTKTRDILNQYWRNDLIKVICGQAAKDIKETETEIKE